MNCTNCGTQLNGTEIVCPNCGTPVVKDTPLEEQVVSNPAPTVAPVVESLEPVAPAPVVPAEPVMEATPVITEVITPTPAVPGVAPVQPAVPPAAPTPDAKPKDNKTIILIIALVVVAIAAVILYFALFATTGSESSSPSSGNNGGNTKEVSTTKEETVDYAGYTFTIPDGYTSKTDSQYGLVINNSTLAFSISVDYSHKYDEYKTALVAKYPDQADKLVANVDGREYLILVLTDTDGSKGSEYITKADDSSVFIGMLVKSDYQQATTTEFGELTKVIDSAKTGSTSFAAGDDIDVGKDGIKTYNFTKDSFKFDNKEE